LKNSKKSGLARINRKLVSVHPEMVDFGSGQGPSVFCNRRYSGTIPRIAEKRERSPGPKDAVSGWILVKKYAADTLPWV